MKNKLTLPTLAFLALFAAACNMSNSQEISQQTVNNDSEQIIAVLTRTHQILLEDAALLHATIKETVASKPYYTPLLQSADKFKADLAAFDAMISDYLSRKVSAQDVDYQALKSEYEIVCSSLAAQLDNLEKLQIPSFRLTYGQSNQFLLASLLGGKAKEMPSQDEFQKLTNSELSLLLHTFQFNARSAYADFIQFLLDLQALDIKFDEFEIIATSPKPSILLGEEYTSELILGAYSRQAKFAINVDGKPIAANNGKAIYSSRPTKAGTHNYTAQAILTNPMTGEVYKTKKVFEYEVLPSPAFVYTRDNDILYVGESHKINVLSSLKNISLASSGTAGVVISHEGGNTYSVRAERQGTAFIKVRNTQNNEIIGEQAYTVKAK
jgi:hypothetical protein